MEDSHRLEIDHRWFHLALATLTGPDQGSMLTKPSIWGI